MMDEERSLSEVLWDYGVYVPIGLAATVVEELSRLTEKGKERAGGQVHTAQMIGKLAVGEGRRQFAKFFGEAAPDVNHKPGSGSRRSTAPRSSVPGAPRGEGTSAGSRTSAAQRRPPAQPRQAPARERTDRAPAEPTTERASGVRVGAASAGVSAVPEVASLAIPGYDTLAASQVVQRLSSLRPDELEAVRRYELGTRGRRTILHRIAQLTTDG